MSVALTERSNNDAQSAYKMFFLCFVHCYVLVTAVPCQSVSVVVTCMSKTTGKGCCPAPAGAGRKWCHVKAPASFSNSLWGVGGLCRDSLKEVPSQIPQVGSQCVCWCQARREESTPGQVGRTGKACGAALHWEGSEGCMGQLL